MFDMMKREVKRAYYVLDVYHAEYQNDMDIIGWYKSGMISVEEMHTLTQYNKELKKTFS